MSEPAEFNLAEFNLAEFNLAESPVAGAVPPLAGAVPAIAPPAIPHPLPHLEPTPHSDGPLASGLVAGSALVVGAGQGIGLEFTRQLLAQPQVERVYATYRRSRAALSALAAQHPQRLRLLPLEITDAAQMQGAIAQIQAQTAQLHFVVNCVGLLHQETLQPEKSLRQIQADQLVQYFQVNSIGAILLAQQLLPLLKHPQPAIFATLSAKVGSIEDNRLGGWYGYRASKAALNMLIKTAAIEYQRSCPNAILALLHPGTTDTQLSRPFQRNVPPEQLFSPERTVRQLFAVLARLTPADSGSFWSWNGDRLPW